MNITDKYLNKETDDADDEWKGIGTLIPEDYQKLLDEDPGHKKYQDDCDRADREYMIEKEDRDEH